MNMDQQQHNTALWVSIAGLFLAIFAAVVSTAVSAGELRARVVSLEQSSQSNVTQAEWKQFATDMRDRLDRIENKLDGERK